MVTLRLLPRCGALSLALLAPPFATLLVAPLAHAAPRVVVLVRHAEKQSDGTADPGLTTEGRARAEALSLALADGSVSAIVTSAYRRTRETAAPTAARFAIEPLQVGLSPEGGLKGHVAAVVAAVRAAPEGTVLIVGHANTVPVILAALGGPEIPELDESDHSSLFTLLLAGEGSPRLIRSEVPAKARLSAGAVPSPAEGG